MAQRSLFTRQLIVPPLCGLFRKIVRFPTPGRAQRPPHSWVFSLNKPSSSLCFFQGFLKNLKNQIRVILVAA
jgi:hypothetical protein